MGIVLSTRIPVMKISYYQIKENYSTLATRKRSVGIRFLCMGDNKIFEFV